MYNQYFFKRVLSKYELKESVLTESFIEDFVLAKLFSFISKVKNRIKTKYDDLIKDKLLQKKEFEKVRGFFLKKELKETLLEDNNTVTIELNKKEQDELAKEKEEPFKNTVNKVTVNKKEVATKFWVRFLAYTGAKIHVGVFFLATWSVLIESGYLNSDLYFWLKQLVISVFKGYFKQDLVNDLNLVDTSGASTDVETNEFQSWKDYIDMLSPSEIKTDPRHFQFLNPEDHE